MSGRRSLVASMLAVLVAVVGVGPRGVRLHAQDKSSHAIAGAWTLNKELSEPGGRPADDGDRGTRGDPGDGSGRRRGGGGGGGGRRGGFGGGGFGRGDGGRGAVNPEELARQRDAMRDITNPPDRFIITETATMILITGPDGRTTRLSPDGKKIKDESTKMERKTKWDGGKLVSEISGLGGGAITETYTVDTEHHQLHRTVQMDNGRLPMLTTRVYDADPK